MLHARVLLGAVWSGVPVGCQQGSACVSAADGQLMDAWKEALMLGTARA